MSQPEVIRIFLEGRIGPWALYRQLVRTGVSVGAALVLALGLPAVARGEKTMDDFVSEARQTNPDDVEEIERLLTKVVRAIAGATKNGNVRPLAGAVARLGANVNVPMNEPAKLNLEGEVGGVPVALSGSLLNLGQREEFRNVNLVLGGNLGQVSVNLAGNVLAPGNDNGGINLGNVRLNIVGNAGNVPLAFRGPLGRLRVPPPVGDKNKKK